jgi:hypothetical protein
VVVVLKEPFAIFPKLLAMPVASIAPEKVPEGSVSTPSAPDRGSSSSGSTTTTCSSRPTTGTGAAGRAPIH